MGCVCGKAMGGTSPSTLGRPRSSPDVHKPARGEPGHQTLVVDVTAPMQPDSEGFAGPRGRGLPPPSLAPSPFARHSSSSPITASFAIGETVGRGHYGRVYAGTCKRTGRAVAIKVVMRGATVPDRLEVEIKANLVAGGGGRGGGRGRGGGHPHILPLYAVYDTPTAVMMVFELCEGGELFSRVVNRGPYLERPAAAVAFRLASALAFLHARGVVHRDVKPENVLLMGKPGPDNDGTDIRLCDFGLAYVDEDEDEEDDNDDDDDDDGTTVQGEGDGPTSSSPSPSILMKTICGTWAYAAPEVRSRSSPYTPSVDSWSVGVLLFILLAGVHPFDATGSGSDDTLQERARAGEYDFSDPAWAHVSSAAQNLIRRLLQPDPDARLTMLEVMHHPWVCRHVPEASAKASAAAAASWAARNDPRGQRWRARGGDNGGGGGAGLPFVLVAPPPSRVPSIARMNFSAVTAGASANASAASVRENLLHAGVREGGAAAVPEEGVGAALPPRPPQRPTAAPLRVPAASAAASHALVHIRPETARAGPSLGLHGSAGGPDSASSATAFASHRMGSAGSLTARAGPTTRPASWQAGRASLLAGETTTAQKIAAITGAEAGAAARGIGTGTGSASAGGGGGAEGSL
jgi:serine/threonine protein kinase